MSKPAFIDSAAILDREAEWFEAEARRLAEHVPERPDWAAAFRVFAEKMRSMAAAVRRIDAMSPRA